MSITQDTALFALACFWVAGWAVVALLVRWQWEEERNRTLRHAKRQTPRIASNPYREDGRSETPAPPNPPRSRDGPY